MLVLLVGQADIRQWRSRCYPGGRVGGRLRPPLLLYRADTSSPRLWVELVCLNLSP